MGNSGKEVNEVFENERYYGISWKPPALLERPKWSDEEGNPVIISGVRKPESEDWQVDVNPSTDADGFIYGSVFRHLEFPRKGGRAVRRVGDFVRRRKWVFTGKGRSTGRRGSLEVGSKIEDTTKKAWESLISPVAQMHDIKVRKQTEADRRRSAFRVFLGMLASTFKRRKLSPLFPADPAAWMILLTKHHSDLISDQAKALQTSPVAYNPRAEKPNLEATGNEGQGPDDLVRDLVCAAVHSRAAYGHAMAAGHLTSIYNFALLHTLHQINFNPVGGASGEANNEAVAALAGIPLEDIKLAEWNNSISRPCHYLAIDKANHCIVLSIRGSLEIGDILSDLAATPMEVVGMLGTGGLVHEGMMMAATFVQCNTGPALAKLAKAHPGWPLLITGHSMGGGVASILALLMRKGPEVAGLGPIRCITMGPAPVLSRELADACNEFTISVVNGADVVPRISYASVEGAFLEIVNSSPLGNLGKKVTQKLEELKARLPDLHPPQIPADITGLPGLPSLVHESEDNDSKARAAHAAASAMSQVSHNSGGDWVGNQENKEQSSRSYTDKSTAEVSRSSPEPHYGLSSRLSRTEASAAAKRLAAFRRAYEETAKDEQAKEASATKQEEQKNSDRAAAAEVLDNKDEEFRDNEGHPQPLYVAGRVLWVLPESERRKAAQKAERGTEEGAWNWISSTAHAACEVLRGFTQMTHQESQTQGQQQLQDLAEKDNPVPPALQVRTNEEKPEDTKLSGDKRSLDEMTTSSADSPEGMASPKRCRHSSQDDVSPTNEHIDEASTSKSRTEQNSGKATPVVLDVERDFFERILVTMEMMQDHLPDNYLSVINTL